MSVTVYFEENIDKNIIKAKKEKKENIEKVLNDLCSKFSNSFIL